MRAVELILPWCPTVNSYYGQRVIIPKGERRHPIVSKYLSQAAKDFHEACKPIIEQLPQEDRAVAPGSPLRVHVLCYPPDARQRDLDNLPKGLLDTLATGGVLKNDADIWDLRLTRECVSQPPGRVVVRIWPFAILRWEEASAGLTRHAA